MFESTRRKIEAIVSGIINDRFNYHNTFYHDKQQKYVCDICGCLLAPKFAVAGEKEIRQREEYAFNGSVYCGKVDYVHTPYYCKVHAPKVEEKEGSNNKRRK